METLARIPTSTSKPSEYVFDLLISAEKLPAALREASAQQA
jgi:hypothetical protein